MDIERLFPAKVSRNFSEMMLHSEWRQMTWEQLCKDFKMSGNSITELIEPDLNQLFSELISAIEAAKNKKATWDNLNYRIDIPQELEPDALANEDLAKIYLLRCFQKVWLRRQFGNKDSG